MTGTLYGLGLGPGDPELMTLKAYRLIAAAQVVAYPAPETGESFARSIAASAIPGQAEEIAIRVPMVPARAPAQAAYDAAADRIGPHLSAGRDVVVLCEGDPFFYGSFMYLHARLSPRFPSIIVPGVSALTGCAAAAGRPLCAREEALQVLPGTLAEAEIAAWLAPGQPRAAIAFVKVGRHLAKIRRAVTAAGRAGRAVYVSHASLGHQRVLPLAEAPETAPYFSMILIPGEDPHAAPVP
ncbi:MAG: precorrin-2 C(20)-methyltransferase [Pikeienuella sp.]